MRERILTIFVALALLASSGAGGGLQHLCGMDGEPMLACFCPHSEAPAPSATLEVGCCELREIPGGPPSSSLTSSQDNSRSQPVVLARLGSIDLIAIAGAARSDFANASKTRSRAGPPIFVEVCSYLI